MLVPSGLEQTYDPWAAAEPDHARRDLVHDWIARICAQSDEVPAFEVARFGDFPLFVGAVPGAQVTLAWVVMASSAWFRTLVDERAETSFGWPLV